jgi:hypothetical protein
MYLPNMHLPFIYNDQYAIIELLDTCKDMVLALFGFTLLQYLDVSMYFFLLVVIVFCLFVFALF